MHIKNSLVAMLLVLFMHACGGSTSEKKPTNIEEDNTSQPLTSEGMQPMSVYNQAYQENYAADNMDDILAHAQNAYVLVDIFDENIQEDIQKNIDTLIAKGNQIGAYISVGTGENYRDDFSALEPYLTPIVWPEWPDEFFVSETTTGILAIMKKRIDAISSLGAQWVEFDNMDWLDEESRKKYSLKATVKEAKAYIHHLCKYTHSKGMKCMAKNTVEGFPLFDAVTYESYFNEKNWWDSKGTKDFLAQQKPVIIVHYDEKDCDGVYAGYKSLYKSDKISFICEDKNLKQYKHYN